LNGAALHPAGVIARRVCKSVRRSSTCPPKLEERRRKSEGGSVPTILDETADGWWARREMRLLPNLTESISNSIMRRYSFAISPQVCARFTLIVRPSEKGGRRECRASDAPAASCALCSWSMHTSIHSGHTGNTRHSPRNGFNSLYRALPGDRALLPPSSADCSANLTPASGCQDHTTLPSASSALVSQRHQRPPQPASRP
jgi:hypothetical protein